MSGWLSHGHKRETAFFEEIKVISGSKRDSLPVSSDTAHSIDLGLLKDLSGNGLEVTPGGSILGEHESVLFCDEGVDE